MRDSKSEALSRVDLDEPTTGGDTLEFPSRDRPRVENNKIVPPLCCILIHVAFKREESLGREKC